MGGINEAENELENSVPMNSDRNVLAAVVIVGHAVKHIFNSGMRALLLPEAKIGLNLTGAQFGSLLTASQVTSWGTTIGAGYLGDRFSNKAGLILFISLSLTGISFFLAGNSYSYPIMLISMLLVGMGPSLYHPPALGELSRRFPDKRGFAISLHGMGGNFGEVLGPLITATVLGLLSWRGVFQISLAPAILSGFIIWFLLRHIASTQPQSNSTNDYFLKIRTLFKNPVIIFIVLIAATRSAGDTAVGGFLPLYLRESLELSPTTVAIYLSLAQVAGLITQPVFGHMSDKYGRKIILLPGVSVVSIISIALAFQTSKIFLITLVILKGAFSFPLHHMFIATAMDIAGEKVQSTIVALIYGAGFLGTFSPYLAGHLVDNFGIHSAFIYGGMVSALAAVMLTIIKLPTSNRNFISRK